MGKEITLFKSEERKSRTDISAFLHHLADKVAEGEVILSKGKEELSLDLPQAMVLEVKVEEEKKRRKGKEHSLEIELKWYDNMDKYGALELK